MKYLLTVFAIFVLAFGVNAQNFDWEWQNPKPQGNNVNEITALTANRLVAVGDAATVLTSDDGGATWTFQQVSASGSELRAVSFVNSTTGFACGFDGLLIKTVDGGATWSVLNSGTTERLYDISFIDADTGYAAGAKGTILKTTNGGASWSASASPVTNDIFAITVEGADNIIVGTASASVTQFLSRSTDFGATWTNVSPGGFSSAVNEIVFADNNTVYILAAGGNLLKSTNGGASFSAITSAGGGQLYGGYFTDANNGYITSQDGSVYKTTNGGTSWIPGAVDNLIIYCITASSTGLVAAGEAGIIAISNDNGTSWNSAVNSVTYELLKKVIFVDENTGYVCGGSTTAADTSGFLLKTTNGGATWTKMDYNFKFQVYSIAMPAANAWYAGTGDNKLLKSTDAGITWNVLTQPITGTTNDFNDIAFADLNVGYAAGLSGKIIKTTDAGATWTDLPSPFGTSNVYELTVLDPSTVVAVGIGAKAYKTTDGGSTWTALVTGIPGTFFASEFKDNFGVIAGYQSQATYLAISRDAGDTWTVINSPENLKGSAWSVGIKDTSSFWVADINGSIAFTNDGGNTWTAANSPSGNGLYDFAIAGDKMWLVGIGGTIIKGYSDPTVPVELTAFSANIKNNKVVLSWQTATETNNSGFEIERKNAGSAWKNIAFVPGKGTTSDASSYSYEDADYGTGKVYYRLKQVDYDGTFEYSNTVELDAVSPVKFELSQNYPNPFNPVTSIKYAVPQKENVTLKVYNVLGKEIAVLVNGVQEAGNYSVKFNASEYSSGVYFYELTSGANRVSKKMILIK
jgi:photosystem II stability/assembly factor-like uncharacterized protein